MFAATLEDLLDPVKSKGDEEQAYLISTRTCFETTHGSNPHMAPHLRALHHVALAQHTLGWIDRTPAEKLALSDWLANEFALYFIYYWRGLWLEGQDTRTARASRHINDIALLNRFVSACEVRVISLAGEIPPEFGFSAVRYHTKPRQDFRPDAPQADSASNGPMLAVSCRFRSPPAEAMCRCVRCRNSLIGVLMLPPACRVALYCSAQCQKTHWTAEHKTACAITQKNIMPLILSASIRIKEANQAVRIA